MKLYENKPASVWTEAFPVGNGRLGAMVYGDPFHETVQLNEETVWSGWYQPDADNPLCAANLSKIRSAIFQGDYETSENLIDQFLICQGEGASSGDQGYFGSYQTAGELHIDFSFDTENVSNYARTLDLETGLAKAVYSVGDNTVCAKTFSSYAEGITLLSYQGTAPFSAFLQLTRETACVAADTDRALLRLFGTFPHNQPEDKGLAYATVLRIAYHNGRLTEENNRLRLENVTSFCLLIDTETTYQVPQSDGSTVISRDVQLPIRACEEKLFGLTLRSEIDFDAYLQKSAAILQDFMHRASLSLGEADPNREQRPTSERIQRFGNGEQDPELLRLYFDFGRYLLVSSSYHCRLPANLQGVWADTYNTPWHGDYHININLQMNYWPSETLGLGELNKPYFEYIRFLSEHGKQTAKVHYGALGWCSHHETNPWGFTAAPFNAYWGVFPLAGAWCLTHIYEHYLFTMDPHILEEYLDVFLGAARFCLDILVEDPNTGNLVTCPSTSPENHFAAPKTGKETGYTAGAAMEIQIIRDIFTQTSHALTLLGKEKDPILPLLNDALTKLPPIRIGKQGTIMEWNEDFEETEPGHRHISHLYALHPSAQITSHTPALMKAAEQTLERRLSHGGGHTGWSRAWIINFYARLGLGDKALENLSALLGKCTLPNLFDNHPPFQIDGNFGGPAGMVEMLLQSHDGKLTLLPALPSDPDWQKGSIRGFCARGGFTVDLDWEAGKVTVLTLHSKQAKKIELVYNGKVEVYDLKQGENKLLG